MRVLLGTYGSASNAIALPSPINYLAVHLKAGERWRYEPPAGQTVLWAAVAFHLKLFTPGRLAGLIALVEKGAISGSMAKEIFDKMYATGRTAAAIVEADDDERTLRYARLAGRPLDARRIARLREQGAVETTANGRLRVTLAGFPVLGVKVVVAAIQNSSSEDLERMVDAIRQELRSGVVVLGSVSDGRVPFVAGVTKDLTARVHAGKLVGEVGRKAGGGGGGSRADFAKGGGTQPAQLEAALQHAFTIVEQALQED